jgi:hypothetical protein
MYFINLYLGTPDFCTPFHSDYFDKLNVGRMGPFGKGHFA